MTTGPKMESGSTIPMAFPPANTIARIATMNFLSTPIA